MVKLTRKIVLLALPLIISLLLVERYDNSLPVIDASIARVKVAPTIDSLDYLFIGPSYCYDGIYTPMFDSLKKSTFILGVATAGPYFYDILIDDYLKSCKTKPKNILINISLATCSDVMDNWSAYPIHRYLNNPISNESVYLNYAKFNDYKLLLRKSVKKSISNIFSNENNINKNFNKLKNDVLHTKGYSYTDQIVNDSMIKKSESVYKKFKTSIFNQKKARCLIDLVKKCKFKNIKVILFEIPTYKLKNYLTPKYINEYNVFKKEIVENNIVLIENGSGLNSSMYFSSIDHMNNNGAKFFTKNLIHKLEIH